MNFSAVKKLNIGSPRSLLSVLLGGFFGLFVYSYWLVDVLPSTSLMLPMFSVFAGLIGIISYFILLELWIVPRFSKLQTAEKLKMVFWGILIGSALMFGGTKAWTSPARYIPFLLPEQTLEIHVPNATGEGVPEISILWVTTSLGDVSYDSMQTYGWVRDGGQLNLQGVSDNSLRWQGRTGADVLILFRRSPAGGPVTISWNGKTETVNLQSQLVGVFQYKRQLDVPFYASVYSAWLAVLVNFASVGIALYLFFIDRKHVVDERIRNSVIVMVSSGKQQKSVIEIAVVALFISLAFLLRVFNLDNLYPYADEYLHLIAAKDLILGVPLTDVYQRSLFTVTLPVIASYSLFGESLWAARLPGVIFNVFAIVPLYLVTRRINRPVAVFSCLLFATSPYVIAFSRNIREYAYHPFYYYWIIYFMILFLQDFPHRFVLFTDWKKLKWKHPVLLLVLGLMISYALLIDRSSTFKLILVAYGVFGLFLVSKFDLKSRGNWLAIVITLSSAFFAVFENIRQFFDIPSMNLRSLEYFFLDPPQQWYFDRLVVLPVLVLITGFYFIFVLRRAVFATTLLYTLYVVYMFFFVFFFKETGFNIHPRFALIAHLWFVPIFAMGIYTTGMFLRSMLDEKWFFLFAVSVILLLAFNPRQVLFPTFFRGEHMPITDLIHDDMQMAHKYMLDHADKKDVLIGSMYDGYARWQGKPPFMQIYSYNNVILRTHADGFSYISSIVDQHPSGWIVIDEQRLDYVPPSLPLTQTVIHGKTVEYVGKFTSQHIWRWSVK